MTSDFDALGLETMSEPHFRRLLMSMLSKIESKQDKTNGRLSKLERFMWACAGGLAVVTAVVVPLFIDVVR